jgi:hypothetical protein
MEQEATDELVGGKPHGLVPTPSFGSIILPLEGNTALIQPDEAAIGDSDPMGIAGQIGQHGGRSGERAFGVDDPLAVAQGREPIGEALCLNEWVMVTEELQFTGVIGVA